MSEENYSYLIQKLRRKEQIIFRLESDFNIIIRAALESIQDEHAKERIINMFEQLILDIGEMRSEV